MDRINSLSREEAIKAFWACCGSDLYSKVEHPSLHMFVNIFNSRVCCMQFHLDVLWGERLFRGDRFALHARYLFLWTSASVSASAADPNSAPDFKSPRGWPTPCLLQARRRCLGSRTPCGQRPSAMTSSRPSVLPPPPTPLQHKTNPPLCPCRKHLPHPPLRFPWFLPGACLVAQNGVEECTCFDPCW